MVGSYPKTIVPTPKNSTPAIITVHLGRYAYSRLITFLP
jgi:hypothetical protein